MSFSSETKNELCKVPMNRPCCIRSELYGILLFCNTFSAGELRILTEHKPFLQRAEKLLTRAAGIQPKLYLGEEGGKLSLNLQDPEQLQKLFTLFSYDPIRNPSHHINLSLLEEDCCRASFLRGAFLAGGSLISPKKSYHLELVTGHYSVSRETVSLLLEMGFRPGSLTRGGNYTLYLKHSEALEDLLTTIGAPIAAMEIMNTKVEKDLLNRVNRRINCDEANLDKTVNAAAAQIKAIRHLRELPVWEELPQALRDTAALRERNPELSLSQLAELSDPPVTKSCMNHRIRRIMELAEQNV